MDALCSYLPASILSYLLEHEGKMEPPPLRQVYKTAVLFADISGYSALCERVAEKGAVGDEYLAKHLNSYFEQLVKIMSSQGGDVFKFAGDAVIVLWPPSSDESLQTLTRRAAQCGLEIKRGLQNVTMAEGITLSVKIGVGVGEISILHVGGVFGRMEYVATGMPLIQAFEAEHHCDKPDVIVSPEAWELIRDHFEAEINDRHAFLKKCAAPLKKVSVFKTTSANKNIEAEVLKNVGKYVPSAVLPFINHHEERWASELRRITVLFVNLGMKEKDINAIATNPLYINVVHDVLQAVQTAVYKYEGSLNKFLLDDKGSTLIAVFGLAPLAHEDDSVRGILASLAICAKLGDLGFKPSIGVTTGMAFCGVVGSRGRREYSVLGDTVNLSARLMQHATKEGGGVICDTSTQYSARHRLHFEELGRITVKGKLKPVQIWQPYSKLLAPLYQSKEIVDSSHIDHSNISNMPTATALVNPLSPSSSILQPIPIDGASIIPTPALSRVVSPLSSANLALVDDETLHLRRKSQSLDPLQLVKPAGSSPANPSASPPKLNGTTSDTIQPEAVVAAADGGSAAARAVDALIAEELSSPPGNKLVRRSSIEARSTFSRRNADGTVVVPTLNTWNANAPHQLMLEIHNFQMEGSVKRHFALVKSRKERRQTLTGKADNNSMDAAVHSSSPHASSDDLSLPLPQTALSDTSMPTTPQTLALAIASSVSISGANSTYSAAALAFNSHLAFDGQRVVFDNVAEGVAPAPEDFAMAYPELARSRRVRGVKVLLPDGLGSLNLSTTHMDSILQLKEELSILCRKRLLLPPAATQLDYFLCLENEQWWGPEAQLPVSSETGENPARVLDAPGNPTGIDEVLGPVLDYMQQQREQWNKKNVAHLQLSENEPASPIAQQTIPEDPPSYPSSFLAQSDLVSLSMCRTLPEYLIDVLPRKMHDVLCHHIGRLVQERRGGTVVIEGLVGLGKTRLMFGALEYMQKMQSDSPSQIGSSVSSPTTLGNGNSSSPTSSGNGNSNIQVLCALANPFEIHKPLSVWRDVFLTAIDSELDRNDEEARLAYPGGSNGSSSQVRANRRKFVESKLKLRRSVGREGLHLLAPVLNEVLQLEIEETEVTKDLDSSARIAHAQNLLLVLMHMFVNPTSAASTHHASNSSLGSPRFTRQPSSPSQLSGTLNLSGSAPASNANPSMIVCIDDAIFLDTASWHLLLRMSRQLPNLLIMLATRPMNRTYQAAFVSGGAPPDFTALIHEPQTTYLVMRSRSDAVIEQIACEALIKNMPQQNEQEASESAVVTVTSTTGTSSSPSPSPSYLAPFSSALTPLVNCPPKDQVLPELPPALAHLILKKAHGSPLVVLELMYNLRKDRLVVVTYDKSPSPHTDSASRPVTVHVDPSFNLSQVHNNPSIPVPITLQCILGCRIDRLSHIQRMILKCCAIIGDEFSLALIARVYPLALENPEADLRRELNGLIELQILQVNDSSDSSRPGSSKASFDDEDAVTHSFRDGFMREMFLSRMLEKQKFDLDEKVSEARLELFRKKAERISKSLVPNSGNRPSSIGPFVTPILCGVLYIRDTPAVVKRTATDDANNNSNGSTPASVSGSSSSGSVAAAAGKNAPATLEYRLRYFALCDSLLLGWTTEEAFLDRKDPLCIYSLEEASTCDDPSRDFGFAIRSLVSLEQFSEYSQTPRTVRFAALNEKEYESWGVKLHEQIRERLLLDQPQPSVTGGAAAGLTVSTGLPSGSGLSHIAEEHEADGGKARSGSISLVMNPLLAASNAALLNAALLPVTPAAPSPSHHSHPSFVIPPAGNKLGDKGSDDDKPPPLDINNMSAIEKETLSKKFISAVENRMAPAVLPQQLLYVKKYRAGESIASAKAAASSKSSSSSSGSLFSSEWKQRYVSLIGEALLLRDKKFDSGHEWTRPTQCFSLSLGSPQASIAANPADAYDASKKVYKLMLEVDMWMKGSSVAWSRRAVVLGCSTYAEAKRLCEKITDVIFANQVAQTQANKQKHQRASTWGNFKTTTTRKGLDMGGPAAGGPSGSRPSVMNAMPGTPVRGALSLPRPSLNLSAANAGQRGINGFNLAGTNSPATTSTPTLKPHVSFGSALNSDDDRRLRASQRQLGQAPSSPSANTGTHDLSDRLITSTSASPLLLPASDDTLTNGASAAAPLALNTVGMDEERQLDQLFSEAFVNISPANGNPDQMHHLFQLLKAKVKSVAKTTRQRMLQAVAGLEKPSGSAPFKRVPSNSDLADSDSNEAEHESTTSTNWGEQLTNCDLDDTTRSWLQINWTNEPSSRNSSGIAKAEKEELDKSEERNRNKIAQQAQAAAAAAAAAANGKPDSPTAPSTAVVANPGVTGSIPLSVSKKPIGDLTSWEWNIFDYATDSFDLLPIVVEIFQSFRFIEVYSITPGIFQSWLNEVYANYFENSYHSFHHAVDVLQTVYSILTTHGAQVYLTTLEKFSLCIAALCHDVRHPGLTNSYHITARTPVAMLYNDQSVLEHHHCATTFKILSNPPTNILNKLTPNEYRTVRGRLTLGILSTDMTCHFTLIEKFNGFLDEQARLPVNVNAASQTIQTADELTDNARSVIFNVLLHACDISNPSKPWPVQRKWSDAVLNEFLLQGDKEKEKGFPISPNCDRRNTDQALLSLNFIDFIVAPIFVSLRNLLPTVQYICVLIKENRTQWTKIFTSNLENNKDMLPDEKQAELARATRRTESFHEIMLPPEDVSRRLSKEVENGNAANAPTAPNSPGTTQPASAAAAAGTPVAASSGTLGVANHSSPLSSTSPRRLAGGSPSPLNDPRRNSLMALKKFVTANSKSNLKLPTARASILVPHNGQLNQGNGISTPSRPLSPAHAATPPSTTTPTSPMVGHASTTPQASVTTGLTSTTPATSPTASKGVIASPARVPIKTSAVGDDQQEEVLVTSKSVPLVAPHSAVAPRLPQSPTTHLP